VGVLVNPALVDWFNSVAREGDIGSVKARGVDLLGQITAGRRQVVFASGADAEQVMPDLAGQVEIIGYDLEHWAATPDEEQADPVGAVQGMRKLADEYGLELSLGPDRRFATQYGAEMAPYVDRFVIQLQGAQDDPQKAIDYALPLIQELRQANGDLRISIVLRPDEDNVKQLLHLMDLLRGQIDGVSVLSTSGTAEPVKVFVGELRSAE